ncbi:hypothetical protein BBJ28_00023374, partial [Nothophytophthora sp. Chile5]
MLRRLVCLGATVAAISATPAVATTFSTLGDGSAASTVAQVAPSDGYYQDDNSTASNATQQQSATGSAAAGYVSSSSGSNSVSLGTTHVQHSIRSGDVSSVGVNLGGWLVAEHWMTGAADFWQGVGEDDAGKGEYTAIAKATDPDTIRSNLENHHSTFITESDIADIAAAGLNTVRVPVGYWIVGFDHDDPSGAADWEVYTNGTLKYLDALITDWAKKHNIAVLISLHAAKGSQNG